MDEIRIIDVLEMWVKNLMTDLPVKVEIYKNTERPPITGQYIHIIPQPYEVADDAIVEICHLDESNDQIEIGFYTTRDLRPRNQKEGYRERYPDITFSLSDQKKMENAGVTIRRYVENYLIELKKLWG